MQRAVQMPAALVTAIQGLVILFVVSSNVLLYKPELIMKFLSRFKRVPAPGSEEG